MKRVVVAIISRQTQSGGKEYLFMRTKTNYGDRTGYLQPTGGHMEEGETEAETILREIKEELGVDAKAIKKLAQTAGDLPDYEVSWWHCEVNHDDFELKDEEVKLTVWLTREKALNETKIWPATRKFFQEFLTD